MTCCRLARPLCVALILLLTCCLANQSAHAQYTTSFGVTNGFLEPTGWTVGDPDSTYQEWDAKAALTGNAPDDPRGVAAISPGSPTHAALPPYFGAAPAFDFTGGALLTSTSNFYAFGPPDSNPDAVFGATADIFNYGAGDPGEGTYVVVQTGSTLSAGVGNTPGTLQLVDLATGDPIPGGEAAAATITQTNLYEGIFVPSQGVDVDYGELMYEFFLPDYFGDFRVEWEQEYSATIDTLRVDTLIGPAPPTAAAVPEPDSALVMLTAAGFALAAYGMLHRRKSAAPAACASGQ